MHEHERNEGSGEQSGPLFEKQAELLVIGMIAGGKGKRLPNPSTIRRYGVLYRTIGYCMWIGLKLNDFSRSRPGDVTTMTAPCSFRSGHHYINQSQSSTAKDNKLWA